MRHIDKTLFQAPASYVTELRKAHLDEQEIARGAHSGLSGDELFELVKRLPSFHLMKQQLLKDQGYVCCYCNRTIPGSGIPTEHVKPKSVYRELTGEYKNLLAACDGGNRIPAVLAGETPYTRETYPLHCDQNKGNREIPLSPLSADCEQRFKYNVLTGKVEGDADVQATVAILNLNHPVLTKERKEAIKGLCYDEHGNALDKDQLLTIKNGLMKRSSTGHYRNLYFVLARAAECLAAK